MRSIVTPTMRGHRSLPRATAPELLDQGCGSEREVARNFAEMERLNWLSGGASALAQHLYPRLSASATARRPLTVLDLGCGAGGTARRLTRWAALRGIRLHVIALDLATRHLALARSRLGDAPGVTLLRADARRLPLPPRSVDFVISSLVLHHFDPPEATALLRAAFACARRGLIMTDLVRGWLPLAAFRLGAPLLARSFLTRHDGALSIRRAYTPAELTGLAASAGLGGARVHAHPGWHMALVVDR